MKKWPKWLKLCLCLLLIAGSLLYIQARFDRPAATPEEAFRRAEQGSLVGPARILETIDLALNYSNRAMLGESDYGCTLLLWEDAQWDDGSLYYYEKSGDITCFFPGFDQFDAFYQASAMPFFLLTDLDGAHRAEMALMLETETETREFHLEGSIRQNGYFLLILEGPQLAEEDASLLLRAMAPHLHGSTLTAAVTVYDRDGQVLGTQTKDLTHTQGR